METNLHRRDRWLRPPRKRSPDAKNPEGVLAEALTLSGFSTRLALQPRRIGLPDGFQSDLSVALSPVRGCPRSGFATIGLPPSNRQVSGLCTFRELAQIFATDLSPAICAPFPAAGGPGPATEPQLPRLACERNRLRLSADDTECAITGSRNWKAHM